MPSLENKLNDLEALIRDKKYKDFVKDSSKLELEIYYIKSKSDFLLDEIREITLSESKNREIVTKLKKDYRDIYLKIKIGNKKKYTLFYNHLKHLYQLHHFVNI